MDEQNYSYFQMGIVLGEFKCSYFHKGIVLGELKCSYFREGIVFRVEGKPQAPRFVRRLARIWIGVELVKREYSCYLVSTR